MAPTVRGSVTDLDNRPQALEIGRWHRLHVDDILPEAAEAAQMDAWWRHALSSQACAGSESQLCLIDGRVRIKAQHESRQMRFFGRHLAAARTRLARHNQLLCSLDCAVQLRVAES